MPHPPTAWSQLLFYSFCWVIIGWIVAWFAPFIQASGSFTSHVGHATPLLLTIILIGCNLRASIRTIIRTGFVWKSLPYILAQIALFHVLFFQIACHLGAQHYDWDHQPTAWDWVQFSAIHAFRASDIIDTLEAIGWKGQTIQHVGTLMTATLIVFHFIINLFFVTLIAQTFQSVFSRVNRLLRALFGLLLIAFIIAFFRTAIFGQNPWRLIDIVLWPIDNFIRIIDFFDAMELGDIHLHSIPKLPWESGLTIICRILMIVLIADFVSQLFIRFWKYCLGVLGYNDRQIDIFHRSVSLPNLQLDPKAMGAEASTPEIEDQAKDEGELLISRWVVAFGVILPMIMALLPQIAPWDSHSQAMIARLLRQVENDQLAPEKWTPPLEALQRMGLHANTAVEPLMKLIDQSKDESFQSAAIATLGQLGEPAFDALGRILIDDRRPTNQLQAVHSLEKAGYRGTPILLRGLASKNENVRLSIREVIDRSETDAVELMVASLTPENRAAVLPLVRQLDPYWYRQRNGSEFFNRVVESSPEVERLQQQLRSPEVNRRIQAINRMGEIGPAAGDAIPKLLERIEDREIPTDVLFTSIARMGTEIELHINIIAEALKHNDPRIRERSLRLLTVYADRATPYLSNIIQQLIRQDATNAGLARSLLETIDPKWPNHPEARAVLEGLIVSAAKDGFKPGVPAFDLMVLIEPQWAKSDEAIRALPELVDQLNQPNIDNDHAVHLLDAIEQIGKKPPGVIPALRRWVPSRDDELRRRSIEMLGRYGNISKPAVVELIIACTHDDEVTRKVANEALIRVEPNWQFQAASRPAVGPLCNRLQHINPEIVKITCGLIQKFGPEAGEAVSPMLTLVKKQTGPMRVLGIETLGRIGDPARILMPELIDFYADTDNAVVEALQTAIERIDGDWRKNDQFRYGITRLARGLVAKQTPQGLTPAQSRLALLRIGPKMIPTLLEELKDVQSYSLELVRLLCQIARENPREETASLIVPAIVQILNRSVEAQRYALLEILVNADTGDIIPTLIERLTDDSPRIRALAVTTLSRRGANLLSTLVDRLKDPSVSIRMSTLEVIDRLRIVDPSKIDDVILKAVRGRLLDPDIKVSLQARRVFIAFGASSAPILVEWLDDLDARTRYTAITTMADYRPADAKSAIKPLIGVLKDRDMDNRLAAITTLGKIGGADANVINALLELLKSEHELTRVRAVEAITRSGNPNPRTLTPIMRLLHDERPAVRLATVQSIKMFAANGKPAIPELVEIMADADPRIQPAILDTLQTIDEKWHRQEGLIDGMRRLVYAMKAAPAFRRSTFHDVIVMLANRSPEAMRGLVELAGDEDFAVRSIVQQELPRVDRNWAKTEGARKAVPVLQQAAASKDPVRQTHARDILSKIAP